MPAIRMTVKELAQIALGTPTFTKYNLVLLHSLLEFLIKKLDCDEDKLYIDGVASKKLEERLKQSTISPIPIITENVPTLAQKYKTLIDIREHYNRASNKINDHLTNPKYQKNLIKEGLHTLCDKNSEIVCSLLSNEGFMQKLCCIISGPVAERLVVLDRKMINLKEEFIKFTIRTHMSYRNVKSIPIIVKRVDELKLLITENHSKFLQALQELQMIMDIKMDISFTPELKKDFMEGMNRIDEKLTILSYPRSAGTIMYEPKYSKRNRIPKKYQHTRDQLIKMRLPVISRLPKSYDGCVQFSKKNQLKSLEDDDLKLKLEINDNDDLKYIQGTNGVYYRSA